MNESKNFIFQLERVLMNKCPHLKQNFHKSFNKKICFNKSFDLLALFSVISLRHYSVQSVWGLWQKYNSYLKEVEYFSKYFNLYQKTQ